MRRLGLALLCGGAVSLAFAGVAMTDDAAEWGPYKVGDKRSGYTYAQPETRAIQEDDFENPAFLLVDAAAELWETVEGEAGKSCADCHDDVESLKGVGARYPVFYEPWGKLIK